MGIVRVFDYDIKIKDFCCSYNGYEPERLKPYVNLYIKLSDFCQANCPFCVFHKETKEKFDLAKLAEVITGLKKKGLEIRKINFTGGEPNIYHQDLLDAITVIRRLEPNVYITINTNGYKIKNLEGNQDINCISLSRHHYDDALNSGIFETDSIPTLEEIRSFKSKDILHIRCNLIKGYIDSKEKIETFMNELSDVGVYDFGFVSLMQVNDFCKENLIDHNSFPIEGIKNTMLSYTQTREDFCSCKNYLHYGKDGLPVKLYSRFNNDISKCESILVYNINRLEDGFDGPVIF